MSPHTDTPPRWRYSDFDPEAPRPRLASEIWGEHTLDEFGEMPPGARPYVALDLNPTASRHLLRVMDRTTDRFRQEGRTIANTGKPRELDAEAIQPCIELRLLTAETGDTTMGQALEKSWDNEQILAVGIDYPLPGTVMEVEGSWQICSWPDLTTLRFKPGPKTNLPTLFTFGLHRQLLYWHLLFSVQRDAAREKLIEDLLREDPNFALEVIERGYPELDLGEQPYCPVTEQLDDPFLTKLLGHSNPEIRRRVIRSTSRREGEATKEQEGEAGLEKQPPSSRAR